MCQALPVVGASVPDPVLSPPSIAVVDAPVVGAALVGVPVSSACVVAVASVGPAEPNEPADSPSFDPPQADSARSVNSARGARMAALYTHPARPCVAIATRTLVPSRA